MADPLDAYAYCTGGQVFLVCQRCGALICGTDDAVDTHDRFHEYVEQS